MAEAAGSIRRQWIFGLDVPTARIGRMGRVVAESAAAVVVAFGGLLLRDCQRHRALCVSDDTQL